MQCLRLWKSGLSERFFRRVYRMNKIYEGNIEAPWTGLDAFLPPMNPTFNISR
jgi:hypothetical protein